MSKFASRFAGVAMIALAALPAFALTHAANAAEPGARVAVGNLNDQAQAAAFNTRLDQVASRICKAESFDANTGSRIHRATAECISDVREEAMAQLSPAARERVAQADRASTTQMAGR